MNGSDVSNNCRPATPRWVGMPVNLIRLRADGGRLTRDEFHAAEPLAGRLILRPTDKFQNGGGASYIAELAKLGASDHGFLGAPLFNPVLERIDHRGIVLSGYETRWIGRRRAPHGADLARQVHGRRRRDASVCRWLHSMTLEL